MTTIYREIDINAPVNEVWEKVSNTRQISSLIGFLTSSTQIGNIRVCSLEGGGEIKEKIVSVDHGLKRVMYSITESPLNMEFHSASMQLHEHEGKTKLIWTVDLLPESASQQMGPMLDGACSDMSISLAT